MNPMEQAVHIDTNEDNDWKSLPGDEEILETLGQLSEDEKNALLGIILRLSDSLQRAEQSL